MNHTLAMATIPFQDWCELYDWDTALKEGTIFPCLNLFFHKTPEGSSILKTCSSALDPEQAARETMMSKINSISFAINDLNLYLDTHPDCPKGSALFLQLLQTRLELLAEFASRFYPLTQLSMITGKKESLCYGWSEGPMPWEGGCI